MATPTVSVTPSKLNFILRRGSTLRRTLTWYQDERQTTPVDLTGYDAKMQIRDLSGVLVIELSVFNGGITLGGAAGTISLYISDTASGAVVEDKCIYDLEMTATNGDVIPLVAGSFSFQDQITT